MSIINVEKLKEALNKVNSITEYSGACVFNGNFIDYTSDEQETFPISITKDKNKYVLTDLRRTLDKLEEQDITLEDTEVRAYVEKVLSTLGVGMGPTGELLVFAVNEDDCAYAIGRLYQAIILVGYIDLQYEEDEE